MGRLAGVALAAALSTGAARSAFGAVGPDVVSQAVQARAAADLGISSADVEVGFLGMGRALDCPEDATVHIEPAPGERWRGVADVTVAGAAADGATCDRLRIRPRVEAWIPAPVAAEPAAPGERVVVRLGRARVGDIVGAPVSLDDAVEARVTLQVGDPVTHDKVRPAPASRSGDAVVVVVAAGPLQVKAPAKLLDDAAVGGMVRVSNLATGAVMKGTLVAPGVVHAGPPAPDARVVIRAGGLP